MGVVEFQCFSSAETEFDSEKKSIQVSFVLVGFLFYSQPENGMARLLHWRSDAIFRRLYSYNFGKWGFYSHMSIFTLWLRFSALTSLFNVLFAYPDLPAKAYISNLPYLKCFYDKSKSPEIPHQT